MTEHRLSLRPDIIVHIPFQRGTRSRREGNFAVFELKLRAQLKDAQKDFEKLSRICSVLGYPLGIFINIDSEETYFDFNESFQYSIYVFAIQLSGERVLIRESSTGLPKAGQVDCRVPSKDSWPREKR